MSTKVYDAFRIAKTADPFDLLWDIKRRGQAGVKTRLIPVFTDILDGRSHTAHLRLEQRDVLFKAWVRGTYAGESEEDIDLLRLYSKWVKEHCPPELKIEDGVYAVSNEEVLKAGKRKVAEGAKPGIMDIDAWVHANYGEQLTRYRRDWWALDVAVTMRRYRNRFYLIPYCDRACLLRGVLDFMKDHERLEEFSYWNNTDPPDDVAPSAWAWRSTVWNDLTEHERWGEYVTIEIVSWMGWHEVSPMMDIMRERGVTDL